jgi:hypothetical protein
MKNNSIVMVLFLIVMLGTTSCATPETQQLATQPPPTQTPIKQETPHNALNTEVVLNMVERLNAGDVEGALAYFSDDAMIYFLGFPPTGIEVYKGKDQIRSLWQDSVDNHFLWEVKVTSTNGDEVNIHAKTWHDFTRQLEVAPLEYMDVYEVIDGKIHTYGSWLTEESLARFKPAFAAVMPPEPTATPFSGSPVSEMTVTVAGGTCTTDNPIALKAGEVKLTWDVQDEDKNQYGLTLFTLDTNKDILDLMVATFEQQPPSWGDMLLYKELDPGKSETYSFNLEKGPLYLICWSKPPDLPIGNSGPITVVP